MTEETKQLSLEALNASIKEGNKQKYIDTNLISDGYHTFGELYDHRITLFLTLCYFVANPWHKSAGPLSSILYKSKLHADGTGFDGWFIVGLYTERGWVTYHLPMDRWEEAGFIPNLEKAKEWDGHTSADVLIRLKSFYV